MPSSTLMMAATGTSVNSNQDKQNSHGGGVDNNLHGCRCDGHGYSLDSTSRSVAVRGRSDDS